MNTRITDEWGSFSAIPNEFIDAAGDLSDQARWLFVILRRYTNGQTGKAFPSYKAIQAHTGWTPKTIAKAVRELEDAGWLIREKALGDVTQYILIRRQHFPQGSEVLPVGKQGTSHREVGVLPVGKSNKIEVKRSNKETPAASPPTRTTTAIDDLGDILEDAYPGHATNWKTMRELRDLVNRVNGTRSDVIAFPEWLRRNYPKKANSPFAFKDLFAEMVRESNATKPPSEPSYCGKCNNGWKLTAERAQPCECQRSTSNENNRTTTTLRV